MCLLCIDSLALAPYFKLVLVLWGASCIVTLVCLNPSAFVRLDLILCLLQGGDAYVFSEVHEGGVVLLANRAVCGLGGRAAFSGTEKMTC